MALKTVNNVSIEFETYKDLIKEVLRKYDFARDSDTYLYIMCCKYLGVETIEDMIDLNLNVITVHKVRQVVQNKEGLYRASNNVQAVRDERKIDIEKYMVEQDQ